MKLLGCILTALLDLSGCKKQEVATATTAIAVSQPVAITDSVTYLALGDSYTIGQSVPAIQSFPFQLSAQV